MQSIRDFCVLLLLSFSSRSVLSSPIADKRSIFSNIVVFGDSLSDTGNGAWEVSNHTWPANPLYYGHRFSNGQVWTEDVAATLDIPLTSYATGGATTNDSVVQGYTGPQSTIPVPSLLDQINVYINSTSHIHTQNAIPNTLFVLFSGANDVLFELPGSDANSTVSSLLNSAKKLQSIGAQHFLFPTLPPLAPLYPFAALEPVYASTLANFSSNTRSLLESSAKTLKGAIVVDFHSLFDYVTTHPAQFGFNASLVSVSCLVGIYGEVNATQTSTCTNPDEYVWWDEYHPTARAHKLMAKTTISRLIRAGLVRGGL